MSGQKEMVARLSPAQQARLEADLALCRENAAELAATANLAGRAVALAAQAGKWLNVQGVGEPFKEKLRVAVADTAALQKVRAETGALLQGAAGARGAAATREDADRAAQVRKETTERLRAIGGLRGRLSDLIRDIEAGIQSEERIAEGRLVLQGRRRRGEVAGIIEEIKDRMRPSSGATLEAVKKDASALRKAAERLHTQKAPPSEQDVRGLREDLDALVRRAEEAERASRHQWQVYQLRDKTFKEARFAPAGKEVGMPAFGDPILATHAAQEAGVHATIKSRVEPKGAIHLVLSSGSKRGSIVLDDDEACPERLAEIVSLARANGLKVTKIIYDGPGPRGGRAISVPGVVVVSRLEDQVMEAK
jgi:hypothetical protein